jgi:hypothetical protein
MAAHIDSPEVIKELRKHYTTFDQISKNALMGCTSDVRATLEWVRTEQRSYWNLQLRKRDEELNVAQSEYSQAKWASGRGDLRTSGVEELRALQRAKRRKEEVEQKIQIINRWTALLEQQVGKLMGPVNALSILLDKNTPRILARLDRMLENLQEYLRPAPTEAP